MYLENYVLSEVIQAIQSLGETEGSTIEQICKFIKNNGELFTTMKMLKTIRALQKLVDDGILVKNGKRYSFAKKPALPADDDDDEEEEEEEKDCEEKPKCDEPEEEEEEESSSSDSEEEEEEDDDDDDDDDEDECNDCPKPKASGDEEEEEEDDDDGEEEEEEEDDDEDGEECDENEVMITDGDDEIKSIPGMGPANPVVTAMSNTQNPIGNGKNGSNAKGCDKKKNLTNGKNHLRSKNPGQKNGIDMKNGLGDVGKDAIKQDNLAKKDLTKCADKIEAKKSEKKRKTRMDSKESSGDAKNKSGKVGNEVEKVRNRETDGRKSRSKRSHAKGAKYHSGSPIKKAKGAMYSLKMDNSLDLGPFSNSSQLFPDTTKTEMDLSFEKNVEDTGMDYDLYRHRSPAGPPPPNTPGVHLNRKESCCSNFDKYLGADIKMQCDGEPQFSLATNLESNSMNSLREEPETRFFRDSADVQAREKHKRDLSLDCDKLSCDVMAKSLCSVCKKKRIS